MITYIEDGQLLEYKPGLYVSGATFVKPEKRWYGNSGDKPCDFDNDGVMICGNEIKDISYSLIVNGVVKDIRVQTISGKKTILFNNFGCLVDVFISPTLVSIPVFIEGILSIDQEGYEVYSKTVKLIPPEDFKKIIKKYKFCTPKNVIKDYTEFYNTEVGSACLL